MFPKSKTTYKISLLVFILGIICYIKEIYKFFIYLISELIYLTVLFCSIILIKVLIINILKREEFSLDNCIEDYIDLFSDLIMLAYNGIMLQYYIVIKILNIVINLPFDFWLIIIIMYIIYKILFSDKRC